MSRKIYVDGIWDCFHMGHVLHFKDIKQLDNQNNYLIVGIISDKDATNYKREPIYNQENRTILVESCKYVDKVIDNAPLIVTEEFIKKHDIDLVCHGFLNKSDANKQSDFFKDAIRLNKFRLVNYHSGISTTDIINKIKNM
jgi:cytidyltransferase-like protein